MAYIDPDGMFGGDRMAMLSDSAKMAWSWFWCAGNTVGRVELNYREFTKTVFRQFKKPPTEQQFWDWVAEFHESYLMFVYQVNGQVWGQWYVTDKYLPTYKTVNDKKTPAPVSSDILEWQEKYNKLKLSLISGKCRVLNISKNFQKVLDIPENLETSEEFHMGVERRGEIEERSGEEENPCAADAAPGPADPPSLLPDSPEKKRPLKAWFDQQHERWYTNAYWRHIGKSESRKAFEKRVCIIVDRDGLGYNVAVQFLIDAAVDDRRRFEPTEDWEWRQNMHPATWLNQERWRDEAKARDPTNGIHKTKQQNIVDMFDRA